MFPLDTNILVVDDMMTTRKVVKKALSDLGYTKFTEAENGEVALGKFRAALATPAPFQLIISDWNMPQLTGIEFLKAVRATPGCQALPFVLLTAESEKSQVIEALTAKVSGYVVKPFTPASLAEKLKGVYAAIQAAATKAA